MGKIIKYNISEHLNTKFREYALYTLQYRGIPSFSDSLTNVQRIILENTKNSIESTLSLVGNCVKSGYSHGDASLVGAISVITRDFNCSESLLEGKGFWGTTVVPDPAAPRYTKIKIKPKFKDILSKYKHLNEKEDDIYLPLHVKYPIGLLSLSAGIAVGYKTLILPRKLEDIERFYKGKIKTVKPWFNNFDGEIKKFQDSWVIKGKYMVNTSKKYVHVTDAPPLMKYTSILKKINDALEKNDLDVKFENESADKINLILYYKSEFELKILKQILDKILRLQIKESIVFINNDNVITYNSIEDYLTDYKIRISEIDYKEIKYQVDLESFNLEYQKAKLKYLKYMLVKKRRRKEVLDFLKKFDNKISSKLDAIKLSTLNNDSIKETEKEIKRLTLLLKQLKLLLTKEKNKYSKELKRFKYLGKSNYQENEEINEILDELDIIDEDSV
jgi:hypothetical protein